MSGSQQNYDVHPTVTYTQAIIANLPGKTGKSIDQWVALLNQCGLASQKDCIAFLKREHGLGLTTATILADHAAGRGADYTDPQAYLRAAPGFVAAMYSGAKSSLRPIYDDLLRLGRSLGQDVKICPCQTIVPLYRNHVFAQIKPTTKTRVDLGLALRSCQEPLPDRLIETGGMAKNDRITHRIALTSPVGIDDEVRQWLTVAYRLDA